MRSHEVTRRDGRAGPDAGERDAEQHSVEDAQRPVGDQYLLCGGDADPRSNIEDTLRRTIMTEEPLVSTPDRREYRMTKRAENAEATRNRILDAARTLLDSG